MKVSDLLFREVRDPRVAGVHLTRVEMSDDLRVARLYWRPPPRGDVEEAARGLAAAGGFLRKQVGSSLRLRSVPELRFLVDELPEQAGRVEELLARIHRPGAEPRDGDT